VTSCATGTRTATRELGTEPTVISIDPGGVTGWSIMTVHPKALVDPELSVLNNIDHWTHGEIRCNRQDGKFDQEAENVGVAEIIDLISAWDGAAVVLEDFILRKMQMDRELLTPVRINGALDYALWAMRFKVVKQLSSVVFPQCNDTRMKAWGLYERAGGMGHARDADRHAIYLFRKLLKDRKLRGKLFPHIYRKDGNLID
jgi:hypothetical protein